MALRTIREIGDPVLTKQSKPIKEMTARIDMLIDDMLDTMYEAEGVGLAAPQVGILKRLVVIDVGDESEDSPYILINPEVIETSGEQTDYEGCLSVPGKVGKVSRPNYAKVRAYDRNMELREVEGEGLLARALIHEIDHLDGKLYVDNVIGDLLDSSDLYASDDEE